MNKTTGLSSSVFILLFMSLVATGPVMGEMLKGRIMYISNKASTIQVDVKGSDPVVVSFDASTRYEGVSGIKELSPQDLIKVEVSPELRATIITKVVFGLPPGVEIDIREMLAILQQQRGPYLLGDARPAKKFGPSHIPSAVSTAVSDADGLLKKLPQDKGQLVVFYCGGPTCPFTQKAVKIATDAGYTNVKGFQQGMPGWKKAKLPLHASRDWLAGNLDPHHVVIDVRNPAVSAKSHLPGAVNLTDAKLSAMRESFIAQQKVARLPGVSDTRAPIILYGDTQADRGVLLAYKELRSWGYSNVAVLEGGMKSWQADGLPLDSGQLAASIRYSKKPVKGAIEPQVFKDLLAEPAAIVFLDVRTDAELIKQGALKGARHIPLDQLGARIKELPADKEIISFCENGIRAEMAYQTLRKNGFKARFLNETTHFDAAGNISF